MIAFVEGDVTEYDFNLYYYFSNYFVQPNTNGFAWV